MAEGLAILHTRRKEAEFVVQAPGYMLSSAQTCTDYIESSFCPCLDKMRLSSSDLEHRFLHLQLCLDGMEG